MMSTGEYLLEQRALQGQLAHALEQCEKDQHLNVAVALTGAQGHALRCLDFFLKGGDVREVNRQRQREAQR